MGQTLKARRLAKQGLKECKKCLQELPLSEFRLVGSGKWPDSYCIGCKKTVDKEYREKDLEGYRAKLREKYKNSKEHYRDLARRSMYNVPLGTYEMLHTAQNGKCAICGSEQAAKDGRKLALDHHHESGIVRGLLCTTCNQGIGAFRENPDLLRAAISYLYSSGYTIEDLEKKLTKVPDSLDDIGL